MTGTDVDFKKIKNFVFLFLLPVIVVVVVVFLFILSFFLSSSFL